MKLEEIKTELKGYFIHRQDHKRELAFKDNNNIELITEEIVYGISDKIVLPPMRYLLMQINNQLLDPTVYVTDLTEVLPIIDFDVFNNYDNRENEIRKHKQLLDKIQNSKSIFGKKKGFKLIYVDINNKFENERKYYVIKDNEVVNIDSALLDNVDNAIEVSNIDVVRNALSDNFENFYAEQYKEECKKWAAI